jgi:NAD(P)-dependent dehydrogenase (short-subunit alcohol dehydrogenase family)
MTLDVGAPRGSALVVGGTRGIGKEVARLLTEDGWIVRATGRRELDLNEPLTWDRYFEAGDTFDLVVFCAGDLRPFPWDKKMARDYVDSFWIHALGPIWMLARFKDRFPWWTHVTFVSSVGAINEGIVDLGYGMAKASLDKAAKALKEHEAWKVTLVRLDLVDTATMYKLPTETLHGRRAMTAAEAAMQILKETFDDSR